MVLVKCFTAIIYWMFVCIWIYLRPLPPLAGFYFNIEIINVWKNRLDIIICKRIIECIGCSSLLTGPRPGYKFYLLYDVCVCIIVSDLYILNSKGTCDFKLTGPRPRGYEFLFIVQCVYIYINVSDEISY